MASSLVVSAIDFGTTYSGWAFSFKHEYESDPTRISCKQWIGGPIISMKAPTAILIEPDGVTLDSFGYDAETKYAELASKDNDDHRNWYFFSRFKMMLHEKMNFDRNAHLEDETQKCLPAKLVFSLAIRYLKEDMLKTCHDRLASGAIRNDEITWVLTVPAIWNDSAKQFMREAAVDAGIASESLKIALEPETASIFSCLLPVEKMEAGGKMESFKPGSIYMVLDAGGGTVDITVHEVISGGKLKELHKASGGAWGSTQVDEAYKKFIISLVGNDVFQIYQRESKESYLEMFREFEIKKREIAPDRDAKIYIRFPWCLKETFEKVNGKDLCNAIKQNELADKVSLSGDKLRVDASIMQTLFSTPIQRTVAHVKEMMQDTRVHDVSNILMVGGFSESKMLQYAIRSNFPSVKVIIPHEASLAVLKGAVVFGHCPNSISQRVCKYTYGIDMTLPFDDEMHDISKRTECEDGPRCMDIFEKYVEIGQTIALNETTEEKFYHPLREDQSVIGFTIYASTHKSPMYVTDDGCVKLGYVRVNILDKSVPIDQRGVLFSMIFGGTEIEVTAKEKRTGNSTKAKINFLG